jgi:putative membrane protein
MIVRDTPGPLDLVFALRGSIVPRIAPRIAVLVLAAAVMVWLHEAYGLFPEVGGLAFTVFGIALSLFLGFRNNAAYERWWEARKLWGGLLADLRTFAREVDIFVTDPVQRGPMLRLALAFLHLHRANLRKLKDDEVALRLGGAMVDSPHPPDAALDALAARIGEARRSGAIDGFGQRALAERLGSMALQQAGCERIVLTPLPYVYSLLIYRTIWLFCLLLPLALIGPAGWLAPLFVAIVGYVFFGLAEVTEELSHPFGLTANGLPLDAICRAAEISLAPHLGEAPPLAMRPRDYFLS